MAAISSHGEVQPPLIRRCNQLKLRYGNDHQQPQNDCHYDELDPLSTSVGEQSQKATHGDYRTAPKDGVWGP
jgi:hypothetical protein